MLKSLLKPARCLVLVTTVGLFLSSCECSDPYVSPDGDQIAVCVDGAPVVIYQNGDVVGGPVMGPTQWSCEDTSGSPVWQGSGVAIPLFFLLEPLGSDYAPRKDAQSTSPRVAFLPHRLLDLPFPAQPSSSDSPPACDASQPDVIQINHDNASVNRITTCPFAPKATIPVATRPLQIQITPDGSTALVTSFDNAVNFIDLSTNQVVYTLQTDSSINPNGIAISPDGTRAYITSFNQFNPVVAVIDLSSRQIIATIPVSTYPQNISITPDGSQLLVTHPFVNEVDLIDTFTNTVAMIFAIATPRGIAFNSKGTKAYIASAGTGTVQELDMNTFQIANKYTVGTGPSDVAVLYSDHYLAVNNYEGQSVSYVNTITGQVQTIGLGGSPTGISILR